jgi:EamA domain-containing membrane protein RarD
MYWSIYITIIIILITAIIIAIISIIDTFSASERKYSLNAFVIVCGLLVDLPLIFKTCASSLLFSYLILISQFPRLF